MDFMDFSGLRSTEEEDECRRIDELGTKLRDEWFRNSDEAYELIDVFSEILNKCSDQVPKAESVLRVLVNLAADSDRNRLKMIQTPDLWVGVKEVLLFERCEIFLGQFVKNTDHLQQFQTFLYDLHIYGELICETVWNSMTNKVVVLEVLNEIIRPEFILEDAEFRSGVKVFFEAFVRAFEREDEYVDSEDDDADPEDKVVKFELLSGLMYTVTQYDTFEMSFLQQVYGLFDLKSSSKYTSRTNRQLFSTLGNLASMTNFDDEEEVKYALGHLKKTSNPYLKAALYLVIGNYITNAEKSVTVQSFLPDTFFNDYLDEQFTDIIQYQSIHTIKNLLNEKNGPEVLNHPKLPVFAKVLSDNQNYYKEIYSTFISFVSKLIRVSGPTTSIYAHEDLWFLFDDKQVWSDLCEFIEIGDDCKKEDCKKINGKLLETVFTSELPSDSNQILARLKSQAIILKKAPETLQDLETEKFVVQYKNLYDMLISSDHTNPQFDILKNNSKFVSGALLELGNEDITTVAKLFLSLS